MPLSRAAALGRHVGGQLLTRESREDSGRRQREAEGRPEEESGGGEWEGREARGREGRKGAELREEEGAR